MQVPIFWSGVCGRGYRVVGEGVEPIPDGTRGCAYTSYTLTAGDGDLFLRFANLETTPEGVLSFARMFGLLGLDERGPEDTPESLATWYEEIRAVGLAVEVWHALKDGSPPLQELEDRLPAKAEPVPGGGSVWYPVLPRGAPPFAYLELFDQERRHQELTARARGFLEEQINLRLIPHCRSALTQMRRDAKVLKPTQGRATASRVCEEFSLTLWATTLRGAIWATFALAIEAGAEARPCSRPGCTKWFFVHRGIGARSDRIYCSNPCRSAAGYAAAKARKSKKGEVE